MSGETSTMTVQLPADTKAQLNDLARQTHRTAEGLATEAIEAYVARERAIVAGIQRGLADMRAGRVVPHDEAMKRLRQTVERTKKQQ